MNRTLLAATTVALSLVVASSAWAFDCTNRFANAEKAIAEATAAMKGMKDGAAKGLVHTLIDDAKAMLQSGKHNHEKPAAGKYDHARSVAKADAAAGYAGAATILAGKS